MTRRPSENLARAAVRAGPLLALATTLVVALVLFLTWKHGAVTPESLAADYEAAAATWEEKGELARAEVRTLMEPLASLEPEAPGNADAHVWMALDRMQMSARVSEPQSRELKLEAQAHYERAIELSPDRESLYFDLAQAYVKTGEPEKSIRLLTGVVERFPSLSVLLAWLHHNYGEADRVAPHAERGSAHWAAVVAASPGDIEARVKWARAEMLLGHDEKMLEILEEGRELTGKRANFDRMELALRTRQANGHLEADPPRVAEALECIEKAFRLNPRNARLVARIVEIGIGHPDSIPDARKTLENLLAAGAPAYDVHLSLGILSMKEEDYGAALDFFERARAVDPTQPNLVLRLARALSRVDPPRHEEALAHVEKAIEASASRGEPLMLLLERGLLLVHLGRYREGITVLEEIAPLLDIRPEQRKEAYLALAEASEALGDADQAAAYRETAEEEPSIPAPLPAAGLPGNP